MQYIPTINIPDGCAMLLKRDENKRCKLNQTGE